jgi:hypothetical protein
MQRLAVNRTFPKRARYCSGIGQSSSSVEPSSVQSTIRVSASGLGPVDYWTNVDSKILFGIIATQILVLSATFPTYKAIHICSYPETTTLLHIVCEFSLAEADKAVKNYYLCIV